MSPEQHQYSLGENVEITTKSDVFQLGKVFYEVFTGENLLGQLNINRYGKLSQGGSFSKA